MKQKAAESATNEEASTSPAQAKRVSFSDLSKHEMVAMIVATAVQARIDGLPLSVQVVAKDDAKGIVIFIPDYQVNDQDVVVEAQ